MPESNNMQFDVTYKIDDLNQTQKFLNELYYYQDLSTKVFHLKRLNLIYETVKTYTEKKVVPIDSALDIGCHVGFCAKMISDLGFRNVLGIDISEEGIAKANSLFAFENAQQKLSYQHIAAEDLALMNKKFDFILCTEVIEHTSDPLKVIDNIKNLLSENGRALITLPNKISMNYLTLIAGKKILGRPFSADILQHLQFPYYKSLKIFRKSGFKVIKTSGTNLFLLDHMLPIFAKFPFILHLDSILSRVFPFKYFTQSFFMIVKVENGEK
jgi:ubiquinone biosynthesis O-methyltransferase